MSPLPRQPLPAMSHTPQYYTPEGFEKAKQALHQLKTQDRLRISQALSDARAKGDLSENAEFHAAKEELELLENKIAHQEMALANARILDPAQRDTSQVSILSTVKLVHGGNGAHLHYTLVPASEANFKEGKISVTSPIGQGLMGKKVGETAQVNAPAGQITFEILEIH